VDVETEKRIMDIISEKLAGKTVVSVLHRLETALQYDKILVMDKGQVAYFGTPAEVATKSELFSS
jgi:ABC-type multidrug transport system fused ATPase/permease subunit